MSNELFSIDPNTGKKVDAHLHVEEDHHRAAIAKQAIARAMDTYGFTLEQARKLFGPHPGGPGHKE